MDTGSHLWERYKARLILARVAQGAICGAPLPGGSACVRPPGHHPDLHVGADGEPWRGDSLEEQGRGTP